MLDNQGMSGSTENIGNLYYVRLNTPLGKFYKIGFTTMKSVNDRLAFQGTGDEKYIEEVLYFQFRLGAYGLEQSLHAYFYEQAAFAKYSAFVDMPLPRNGQSELYYDDVLKLDGKFTPAQAEHSRKAVELAVAKRTYTSEIWAKRVISFNNACFSILMGLAKSIGWSIKAVKAVLGVKAVEEQLPKSVLEERRKVEIFLAELKREQDVKLIRTHREIKILRLIHAFNNRDIDGFRALVNTEELSRDIANSMISDFVMLTDYMTLPNNAGMFSLLEAMNHENCHELLISPVVRSYIPMIEEFIASRTISDTSIKMPRDPLYAVDPECSDCGDYFTEYFGAQQFMGLLNSKFIGLGPYKHDDKKSRTEFMVELEDQVTTMRFSVCVVVDFSKKMLRFAFPNADQVIREYQGQVESGNQPAH